MNHSQRCRDRLEAILKETDEGRDRLGKYETRFAHFAEETKKRDEVQAEQAAKRVRAGTDAVPGGDPPPAGDQPAGPDTKGADPPTAGGRPAGSEDVSVGPQHTSSATPGEPGDGMQVDGGSKRSGDDGGEVAGAPEAKRGRADTGGAHVAHGSQEAPADQMDAGALVPTFGLEILADDVNEEVQVNTDATSIYAVDGDDMDDDDGWDAYDDVKGGPLDPQGVQEARAKEIEYLKTQGVYGYSTNEEARTRTGKNPIKLKWIDSNKGDTANPNYRSRLVCTEVRRKGTVPIFSATPPLEAIRILVAKLTSEDPTKVADPLKAMLVDVSRAHFYAPAVREVFIELPREDPLFGDGVTCGKLLKTMYGTLDAAEQWGRHYTRTLINAGFVQGKASPCHFFHPSLDIWAVVHGNDFLVIARRAGRDYFEEVIRGAYEVNIAAAGPCQGDDKELRVLGRVLTFRPDGVTLQADPRLHEVVVQQLGLARAKGVSPPGCYSRGESHRTSGEPLDLRERRIRTEPVEEEDPDGEDVPLTGPRLDQYASLAARLNYLAMDRPDLQFSVKELMRYLSRPTERQWTGLKRATRYLIGRPRLAALYPWTPLPRLVTIYVDSDFAGCAVTRKSTAGGAAMWGSKMVKTWSKTMAIIALSSGEAELGAVTRGVAEGLGLKSVLADFGVEISIDMMSDATAAIGMCRRLGLGRVRHLATVDLWVQQRVKSGEVALGKLPGTENPADAMTKYVGAPALGDHCRRMGLVGLVGRPASVPAHEGTVIGHLVSSPVSGFVEVEGYVTWVKA